MSGIVPVQSTITVTTHGTRAALSADTGILASSIYLEALGTNTGYVYIGTSTVSSTNYIARLSAGQGIPLQADAAGGKFRARGNGLQLSSLYADVSVDGEKVQVTYQTMVSAGL